jgi:hypothetical protein
LRADIFGDPIVHRAGNMDQMEHAARAERKSGVIGGGSPSP